MAFLEIDKLVYGHIKGPVVVNSFSAKENSGLVFLFGEKGSGKTTLLELLCGINDLYYGKILIDGKKPKEATKEISYLPAEPVLIKNKTAQYNLEYAAKAIGRNLTDYKFDDWTTKFLKQKVDKLSTAQKQILCLKRAAIKDGKLLLLDLDLSKIKENEQNGYINELKSVIFAENKLVIVATSADDYKKLQIIDKNIEIWYQNAAKISKYSSFEEFEKNIEYANALDYVGLTKEKAIISQTPNGYILHVDNCTIKLDEKYLKNIVEYFEVSDSTGVYVSAKTSLKNLSDAEFNKQIDAGNIMLFDEITTQRLK